MSRLLPALCAALACAPPVFADAPRFKAVVIEPQAGYQHASAGKVNDHGDFCVVQVGAEHHVSLWLHGSGFMEIPAPANRLITACNGLNDTDSVVGEVPGGAFFWSPARGWIDIPPPAGYELITPDALNDRDEVVGTVARAAEPHHTRAFSWTPASGLRLLDARTASEAASVNEAGVIAFDLQRDGQFEAGLFAHGKVHAVGSAGPITSTFAVDLNAAGQMAVNAVGGPIPYQAGFWSRETGLVAIYGAQFAQAIDASGNVLVRTNDNVSAFWGAGYGLVRIANAVAEMGKPVTNLVAFDMSPAGVAAGAGTVDGVDCAVLFVPLRP